MSKDIIRSFNFTNKNIRGKVLRIENLSKELLKRFSVHKSIDELFLENIALSFIIANNFKFDGIFKLQLNCFDAPLKAILCDNKSDLSMRAFLSVDDKYFDKSKEDLSFKEIVGNNSFMVFHLDQKIGEPYQSIIPLEGDSLTEVINTWYKSSEQINTFIKIFTDVKECKVGAIFLQVTPDYANENKQEETLEDFKSVQFLTETLTKKEMFEDEIELILHKLFNEYQVEVFEEEYLTYKCSCSQEKIADLVSQMKLKDPKDIPIEIECNFCGKVYNV